MSTTLGSYFEPWNGKNATEGLFLFWFDRNKVILAKNARLYMENGSQAFYLYKIFNVVKWKLVNIRAWSWRSYRKKLYLTSKISKLKKIKIVDFIKPQIFEKVHLLGLKITWWNSRDSESKISSNFCSENSFKMSVLIKFIARSLFLSKPEILTKSAGEPPINLIPGFGWTNFRLRILWIFDHYFLLN